jgi:hypothetical protein
MTDANTGRVLMSANTQPIWGPAWVPLFPSLEPAVEFVPLPDGYDVTYTFFNPGPGARSPGSLYVPGIRFGQTVQTRDFFVDGKATTLNHNNDNYFGGGQVYPGSTYSPTITVSDGEYTIGASLKYPLLNHRHLAFIRLESPGGTAVVSGRNWQFRFDLNPLMSFSGQSTYNFSGDIPPGASRQYTISVRVIRARPGDHPAEWLRTLAPYKDYFQCLYGGVRYTRDVRPVLAQVMATTELLSPSNPLGMTDYWTRIDQYGWGPRVDRLNQYHGRGWDRITLWAPTGLYYNNRGNNYPFQFTTHWTSIPLAVQSQHLLAAWPGAAPGRELGLWWGRAAHVMNSWDTPVRTVLDPANATHRQLAFAELDGAAAVNATAVGLDTLSAMPAWKAYSWLLDMRARHPQVKFIIEPMTCDVLHTLAGSYILATRRPDETHFRVTDPHYLADFLLPGHETWGQINEVDPTAELGLPPGTTLTHDQFRAVMERVANLGYNPQPASGIELLPTPARFNAAPSWTWSVPPDLQAPPSPRIIRQPTRETVANGSEAMFHVQAEGLPPLEYQWFHNGAAVTDGFGISGATTADLMIYSADRGHAGVYSVLVTNRCGQTLSVGAPLNIGCPADFDLSGTLNPDDLADFISAYFNAFTGLAADFDGSGNIDPDDLSDFIAAFFAGC